MLVAEGEKIERPARDYARLHREWYLDEVLEAVADLEPIAMSLWPVLIGMSKKQSHHIDNPDGVISTTLTRLAEITRARKLYGDGDAQSRIRKALDLFAEGLMVETQTGRLGSVNICLTRWSKWQVAQGGMADRKQSSKDRLQGKGAAKSQVSHSASQTVTQTETETETQTETETNTETPVGLPAVPGGRVWPGKARTVGGRSVTAAEREAAWCVFVHWVTVTGRDTRPGVATRLTKERATKVVERLRDPQTVDALCTAIDYWLKDPHHAGQNERSKVYDDIVTLLRNETKVQAALEAVTAPPRPATTNQQQRGAHHGDHRATSNQRGISYDQNIEQVE